MPIPPTLTSSPILLTILPGRARPVSLAVRSIMAIHLKPSGTLREHLRRTTWRRRHLLQHRSFCLTGTVDALQNGWRTAQLQAWQMQEKQGHPCRSRDLVRHAAALLVLLTCQESIDGSAARWLAEDRDSLLAYTARWYARQAGHPAVFFC